MRTPIKINILGLQDFTPKEKEKALAAIALLEKIVNSPKFERLVKARTYTYTTDTGEQVYEKIQKGNEIVNGIATGDDNEIDLDLTIYTSSWFSRTTVGYTYPSTIRTWINRRFFSWYSVKQIASNLLHEWLHKLGYGHPVSATKDRPNSVNYAMNDIVENNDW